MLEVVREKVGGDKLRLTRAHVRGRGVRSHVDRLSTNGKVSVGRLGHVAHCQTRSENNHEKAAGDRQLFFEF